MVYDRERILQGRLNAFMQEQFGLPTDDYYSRLNQQSLGELKSVLSDINNIFTLKVCLAFAGWLGKTLALSATDQEAIKNSIRRNPPNANGYDVEISKPIEVIAEVKCNVPINRGAVYGSAQRDGIVKDVNSLVAGKSKSQMKPDACLKFLVLLDTPEIRDATKHFVKNMKQHREKIVFVEPGARLERKDKVYIVYVNYEA